MRDGVEILSNVDWVIESGQRWVVLGPNGAGKTSLLSLVGAQAQPAAGTVSIVGEDLANADIAELRSRVGMASDIVAARLSGHDSVRDVVLTASRGLTGRGVEKYEAVDVARAESLLAAFGMSEFADREFQTLSEGERKRVQIARSLMADPELLLLDEPAAGLDLAGREQLLAALTALAADPRAPVLVMVTHHVEEIPPGFGHVLLMRDGKISAAGELSTTLTEERLAETYGMPLQLEESDGRYRARGRTSA